MNEKLEEFYRFLNGKRVALLGVGVSNTPLAGMFAAHGARVTVRDRRSREKLGDTARELEEAGAALRLGDDYLEGLSEEEIVFRAPGVRYTLPELAGARRGGVAVTSEMELFFELCPCRIVAVTGSEGKTTTTTVLSKMFAAQGFTVHLGGNIGRALLPEIERIQKTDIAVVELSSFQLISMRRSPDIAVITNITPNHLDVHKDMAEYVAAKLNIVRHQNAFGRAVLNLDYETTRTLAPETRGECVFFSRREPVEAGAYLCADGTVLHTGRGGAVPVMRREDIALPGDHNVENFLAAVCAAWGLVTPENMRQVARTFRGVEHRIEWVRTLGGADYYNDSIATTPTRTIAGLNSFQRPVVLIAGGSDKRIPFGVMGPKVVEKVRTLILLGVTAEKIERAVRETPGFMPGKPEIVRVGSLEEAVHAARAAARPGDIVTLSPACASFDMFPNFEARGDRYRALVQALE